MYGNIGCFNRFSSVKKIFESYKHNVILLDIWDILEIWL